MTGSCPFIDDGYPRPNPHDHAHSLSAQIPAKCPTKVPLPRESVSRTCVTWQLTVCLFFFPGGRVFVFVQTAFILTWALNEVVHTNAAGTSAGALPTVSHPALVQAIKFAMSAMFYFGQRRSWLSTAAHANTRADQGARLAEEAVPLHGLNEDGRDGDSGHAAVRGYRLADARPDIRVSRTLAIGLTLAASVLFTYYDYLVRISLKGPVRVLTLLQEPIVRRLTGPTALYLISSTATLCVLAVAYIASFAVTTPSQWLSVLLPVRVSFMVMLIIVELILGQFSGFWIACVRVFDITMIHSLIICSSQV